MTTYSVHLDYKMVGIEAENEEEAKLQLYKMIENNDIDYQSIIDHMEVEEIK